MRKDKELVCAEHDKFNRKSVCAETRHDALAEKLKDELYRVIFMYQEEECLESECIMNKIVEEFTFGIRT